MDASCDDYRLLVSLEIVHIPLLPVSAHSAAKRKYMAITRIKLNALINKYRFVLLGFL